MAVVKDEPLEEYRILDTDSARRIDQLRQAADKTSGISTFYTRLRELQELLNLLTHQSAAAFISNQKKAIRKNGCGQPKLDHLCDVFSA